MMSGFYATKTHTIIPVKDCSIQNPSFSAITRAVCKLCDKYGIKAYDENTSKGLLRHIYLRAAEATGEIMLCLVVNGNALPNEQEIVAEINKEFPQIVSILLNTNTKNTNVVLGKEYRVLYGKDYIEDVLCGLRFRISAQSFYQVNREGAELLYGLAAEKAALDGTQNVADLYCGTGTIGLSVASKAKKLVGIEIVESAVECAKQNAEYNGIDNAEFFCADAGNAQNILNAMGGERPDVVIIDPPRKGSTKELVDCLAELCVPKVVYVSCDPTTLARDCAWFKDAGYEIGEVQPVDMFPRTGHVESVVCLTRTFNN
jgi:23S rRNA (uracil1939-C5)-methyltransferase